MLRFLIFVGAPLAEMAILVWSGSRIGVGPTLGVVFLTGVVGASLVKRQGLAVWESARARLAEGAIPSAELAHGAMLLVAGAFLIAPGYLTDLVGVALLIPRVREGLRHRLGGRFARRFDAGPTRVEVWRV